jgi:uncharacterized protein YecE (DUF72 family)
VNTYGDIRIGISGWRYKGWRGVFYPKDLLQKRELEYASRVFRSIEINGTFYSLQRPESFQRWAAETPEDFVFAVKGPRFITHMKKLRDAEVPLANFLASGVFHLGHKLGPILWQLPPNFGFDCARLEAFFKLLPRDTQHAADIARVHDKWLGGRVYLLGEAKLPMHHALEIRHDSFRCREFVELLRAYNVALVVADTVEWPRLMDVTADFVYCRLHGSKVLYASGYGPKEIDKWACRVAAWAKGGEPADAERAVDQPAAKCGRRDVYFYFDNDAKVRAPVDAKKLVARVNKLIEMAAGRASR